jgi:cytochrome oxidase Cu insertion factor (SCO1/SenC/PrrC family)
MRNLWTAALVAGLLPAALAASGRADDAPDEKTGLKLGTRAPTFALSDQNGKERRLDEFLKKGKVALVFYRSAEW